MKALEDLDIDNQDQDQNRDQETVSFVLNTIIDKADANDNDDLGSSARISKRSITSTTNIEKDEHDMKRQRNGSTTAVVSV